MGRKFPPLPSSGKYVERGVTLWGRERGVGKDRETRKGRKGEGKREGIAKEAMKRKGERLDRGVEVKESNSRREMWK